MGENANLATYVLAKVDHDISSSKLGLFFFMLRPKRSSKPIGIIFV